MENVDLGRIYMDKEKDMNFFNELLKDLVTADIFEKLRDKKPAKIEYSIKEDGIIQARTEGRLVEQELLAALIVKDQVKKIFGGLGGLDAYLELMKKIILSVDGQETVISSYSSEKNKDDFDIDKFKDIFKDLGL